MHLQPSSTWHLFDAGSATPVRLDDDGRAEPALSGTPHGVLATLAEAIHAKACHLAETHLLPGTVHRAATLGSLNSRRVAVSRLAGGHPKGSALMRLRTGRRSPWAVLAGAPGMHR